MEWIVLAGVSVVVAVLAVSGVLALRRNRRTLRLLDAIRADLEGREGTVTRKG